MANVQVFQRHAHLAGAVKLEFVNGREGKVAKGVLTAISNTRRGSGDTFGGDNDMVDVELLGRQVVESGGALAHQLIELLADGHLGVVARLQVVEPGAGFQQLAQHVDDEGDRRQGADPGL